MDLRGFDANDVEPNDPFDPIPAGDYTCVVVRSEQKPNNAGTGAYLELEFEVLDGAFKGRRLWDRLNLHHPNETTVKIARQSLSSICRAVGVPRPNDSVELHDLPLVCRVRIENRRDTDEPANVIKGYRSRNDAVGGGAAPPPAAGPPAAGPSAEPPWKRPASPASASA